MNIQVFISKRRRSEKKNMEKERHKVNEFWVDTSKNLDALENEFKRFDVCMGGGYLTLILEME